MECCDQSVISHRSRRTPEAPRLAIPDNETAFGRRALLSWSFRRVPEISKNVLPGLSDDRGRRHHFFIFLWPPTTIRGLSDSILSSADIHSSRFDSGLLP